MKVLITTSQHACSFELAYLLRAEDLVFGDAFDSFPQADSFSLAHELLKFCMDEEIGVVFPLRKAEIQPLAEAKILFEEFGIELMVGSSAFHLNRVSEQAESFSELSSNLLKLGYPIKKIALGRTDCSGDLMLIDDEQKDFNQVWGKLKRISFAQIGKLFNQVPFEPLSLYLLEDGLNQINALWMKEQLSFPGDTFHDRLQLAVRDKFFKDTPDGCYQVTFSGDEILRIKNINF